MEKNSMRFIAVIVGVAMAATPPLAVAGSSGFYGVIDLGQSKFKGACDLGNFTDIGATSVSCKQTDTAYRISAGYQINDNFSAEAGYLDAGKVGANIAGTYLGVPYTGTAAIKDSEWQLAAIGTIPLGNNFSVFGKAGLSRWDVRTFVSATAGGVTAAGSGKATGIDFLWGLGAKYDITPSVALRAQFESHKAGDVAITGRGTIEMLNLGLIYKI